MTDLQLLRIDVESREIHTRPAGINAFNKTSQTASDIEHRQVMIEFAQMDHLVIKTQLSSRKFLGGELL
jgi:hypothetical protein